MRNKNRARSFMQVRSSRSNSRSKRGVSPVIGVILMVAATIVIAGVVMGMLGGFKTPKRTYSVAATAEQRYDGTNYDIIVTFQGGPDADLVTDINVTIDSASGTNVADDSSIGTTVGSTKTFDGSGSSGANNDHVVVYAKFTDGSKQVILDTWV